MVGGLTLCNRPDFFDEFGAACRVPAQADDNAVLRFLGDGEGFVFAFIHEKD